MADEKAQATAEDVDDDESAEPSDAERDLIMLVRRYRRELGELLSGTGTISDVESLLRSVSLETDDVYRSLTSEMISSLDDAELVDAKKGSTPGGASTSATREGSAATS